MAIDENDMGTVDMFGYKRSDSIILIDRISIQAFLNALCFVDFNDGGQ